MLSELEKTELKELPFAERNVVLGELQHFLVTKIQAYPIRQGLKVRYDPSLSTTASVRGWLEVARRKGKEGPVAHHLIGAALQLRFPELAIGIESVSRDGDFRVGDTYSEPPYAPSDKCNNSRSLYLYQRLPRVGR